MPAWPLFNWSLTILLDYYDSMFAIVLIKHCIYILYSDLYEERTIVTVPKYYGLLL